MVDFNVQDILGEVDASVAKDIREDGSAILTAVAFGTPVGNPTLWKNPKSAPPGYTGGHLRRNWLASVGGFDSGEIGIPGRASGQAEGAVTVGRGNSVIETYTDIDQGILVIQNNVEYVVAINNGHGDTGQAPANFVEMAIQIAGRDDGTVEEI